MFVRILCGDWIMWALQRYALAVAILHIVVFLKVMTSTYGWRECGAVKPSATDMLNVLKKCTRICLGSQNYLGLG